jgi:glycosyltransferase involved in cell wall biosynthesis
VPPKPVLATELEAVVVPPPAGRSAAGADVSIVIPTMNRGLRVAETIEKCLALDPPPGEIIIVDDHSDAECARLLRSLEGAVVKYIRLPENHGPAMARSIGFASARGKYIVSLDDDSWFLEGDALRRIGERFDALPNCGILSFFASSHLVPVQPAADRLTIVADHLTCGAAYRAEVLHRTGYHIAFMRYMGEESDLSVKVVDAGYDVVHDESVRFFHDYDPSRRPRSALMRVRRLSVRNDLLRAWIFFPIDIAVALTVWRTMSQLAWGARHQALVATIRGVLGFVWLLPQALSHRQPVSRAAARKYLARRRTPEPLR